jgi:hypothetical protein
MNPFLDKKGAAFGALIMATTLITVLALNAASAGSGEHPVYWVTVPAAFIMLCWDLGFGWLHRHETRQTAASYRREMEEARAERAEREESYERAHGGFSPAGLTSENKSEPETDTTIGNQTSQSPLGYNTALKTGQQDISLCDLPAANHHTNSQSAIPRVVLSNTAGNSPVIISGSVPESPIHHSGTYSNDSAQPDAMSTLPNAQMEPEKFESNQHRSDLPADKANLLSEAKKAYGSLQKGYAWLQETFPTVMAVMAHLPFALVPFAFAMFVLVQALVSKGWVNVFAYGWYHWSKRTGTVGSIGGMGFLSCVLSNVSSLELSQNATATNGDNLVFRH